MPGSFFSEVARAIKAASVGVIGVKHPLRRARSLLLGALALPNAFTLLLGRALTRFTPAIIIVSFWLENAFRNVYKNKGLPLHHDRLASCQTYRIGWSQCASVAGPNQFHF